MVDPGAITGAVNAARVRSMDAVFPRVYEELRTLAAGLGGWQRSAGVGG